MGGKIIICWVLGVGCLISCVTKKKAVDQTKTEVDSSASATNQIDRDLVVKSDREIKAFTATDFASAMNAWKIGYDGQPGDSFRFWMNQTPDGFEAGAEGTGTANAEGTNEETHYEAETVWKERFDSLAELSEKRYAESELRYAEIVRQLTKEKEEKGTTTAVYIIVGVAIIVVIFLLWLGRKFNIVLKEVRAVLNRF